MCNDDILRVVIEGQRAVTCDDEVEALGVTPGLKQSTVSGLLSGHPLKLLSRAPEEELNVLKRLQQWAYSITPTLTLWRDNCLQLEIGRCLLIHGGLEHLIEKITAELDRRGFTTHMGIGPSQESAWLFSQTNLTSEASQLDDGASLEARLGPIALHRLDTFEKDISALNKAGIHRFGELLALPPESLKRRCSQAFCNWVDRLLCRVEVAIEDFHPEPEYSDIAWLGYGSTNNQELIYPMEQLLQGFSQFLRNTQLQTQHIRWNFIAVQGESPQLHVHSSECHNNPNRWLEQSRLKLERLQFDDLIEGISLTACELSSAQLTTQDLFLESKHQEPLSQLIDRLRSRLGFQAVSHVYERTEHLPEHCSFADSNQLDTATAKTKNLRRPFWLLKSPQPISQRGNQLYWMDALEIISGPERLEDCWWSQPTSRDYYIAKTSAGQPVWIFQDRHNRCWFLQGVFE